MLVAVVLAGLTTQRARVFQSDLTLWTDATRQEPGLLRPHLNRRNALMERGQVLEALQECATVLDLLDRGLGTPYARTFAASRCWAR